jgi:hypothetical protein
VRCPTVFDDVQFEAVEGALGRGTRVDIEPQDELHDRRPVGGQREPLPIDPEVDWAPFARGPAIGVVRSIVVGRTEEVSSAERRLTFEGASGVEMPENATASRFERQPCVGVRPHRPQLVTATALFQHEASSATKGLTGALAETTVKGGVHGARSRLDAAIGDIGRNALPLAACDLEAASLE